MGSSSGRRGGRGGGRPRRVDVRWGIHGESMRGIARRNWALLALRGLVSCSVGGGGCGVPRRAAVKRRRRHAAIMCAASERRCTSPTASQQLARHLEAGAAAAAAEQTLEGQAPPRPTEVAARPAALRVHPSSVHPAHEHRHTHHRRHRQASGEHWQLPPRVRASPGPPGTRGNAAAGAPSPGDCRQQQRRPTPPCRRRRLPPARPVPILPARPLSFTGVQLAGHGAAGGGARGWLDSGHERAGSGSGPRPGGRHAPHHRAPLAPQRAVSHRRRGRHGLRRAPAALLPPLCAAACRFCCSRRCTCCLRCSMSWAAVRAG